MRRRLVDPPGPFAPRSPSRGGGTLPLRPGAARRWRPVTRVLVAPLAALLAAIAGLVYVLLLPICGIASIAQAAAVASWAVLRDALGGVRPRAAPRR